MTSPYSGSTATSNSIDFDVSCDSSTSTDAPERMFSIEVPAGQELRIRQTTNDYDSRHELRYGGECPGSTVLICRDDPDTQEETWLNDTGMTQTAYFIIDGFGTQSGTFELEWSFTADSLICTDLGQMTSPYSGSTATSNSIAFDVSCDTGTSTDAPERVFSIEVPAGQELRIQQTTNDYDSRHELRYGGECPGSTSLICRDDPDNQEEIWVNDTGMTQTAYFIIDGYGEQSGTFELEWSLSAAAHTCEDLEQTSSPVETILTHSKSTGSTTPGVTR